MSQSDPSQGHGPDESQTLSDNLVELLLLLGEHSRRHRDLDLKSSLPVEELNRAIQEGIDRDLWTQSCHNDRFPQPMGNKDQTVLELTQKGERQYEIAKSVGLTEAWQSLRKARNRYSIHKDQFYNRI